MDRGTLAPGGEERSARQIGLGSTLVVGKDPKLIGIGFGGEAELDAPGVVFRPFQEPTPRIEHGIAWFDTHASPFVDGFVGVARELVAEAPSSRAG
jgi:hypothetical protein